MRATPQKGVKLPPNSNVILSTPLSSLVAERLALDRQGAGWNPDAESAVQLELYCWWPGTESVLRGVLITRMLLILRWAERAEKATMPVRRYKNGTKFDSPITVLFTQEAHEKIAE